MIQLLLMLLGLAFSNGNTTNCDNHGNTVTTQNDPGTGFDPGDPPGSGGNTGGNTGQTPPPSPRP